MFFNKNIEYLTRTTNVKQSTLANLLNISRQSVQGYIKQNKQPRYELLIQICDIYRITVDDILKKDLSIEQ